MGLTLKDVATFLEGQEYFAAAFTEDEVIAAQQRLPRMTPVSLIAAGSVTVVQIAVFGTIAFATIAWAFGDLSAFAWVVDARCFCSARPCCGSLPRFPPLESPDPPSVATARQTGELTGVFRGEGVFFNYAFLVVWLADAAGGGCRHRAHETRSSGCEHASFTDSCSSCS